MRTVWESGSLGGQSETLAHLGRQQGNWLTREDSPGLWLIWDWLTWEDKRGTGSPARTVWDYGSPERKVRDSGSPGKIKGELAYPQGQSRTLANLGL